MNNKWIPISERRPTDEDTDEKLGYGCVLAFSETRGIDTLSVDWINDCENDITFWMPLSYLLPIKSSCKVCNTTKDIEYTFSFWKGKAKFCPNCGRKLNNQNV